MSSSSTDDVRAWGVIAIVCYVLHAAELVLRFPPENLLWSCNTATLLVIAGLLWRRPLLNAAGCFMLVPGNIFWVLDLLGGAPFLPTSLLTHVLVFVLSIAALRRLGLPPATWWTALVGIALSTAGARLVGTPEQNVNVAFHIPPGYEWIWPSHGVYMLGITAIFAAGAWILQRALTRLLGPAAPA
jgi:hypothetical protein